jgi:hypothetical protein
MGSLRALRPTRVHGLDTRGHPAHTGVVTEDATRGNSVCCGQGGAWAPPAGQPLVIGCVLCPRSATYWRTHRADGRPYQPAPPLVSCIAEGCER